MSYLSLGTTTNIFSGVTFVECHKQVCSWRLLYAILELLIPTCNCTFIEHDHHQNNIKHQTSNIKQTYNHIPHIPTLNPTTTLTGTIFGHRHGKVSFCIQANPNNSTTPLLLLELDIPTTILAREIQGGHLRTTLKSTSNARNSMDANNSDLLSMQIWNMYCNGRKAGFVVKRKPSKADKEILGRMKTVLVGAGVISTMELEGDNEIMYLRGNFQRVRRSLDSETFHLIDPDGNVRQELSIFFLRSRCINLGTFG